MELELQWSPIVFSQRSVLGGYIDDTTNWSSREPPCRRASWTVALVSTTSASTSGPFYTNNWFSDLDPRLSSK